MSLKTISGLILIAGVAANALSGAAKVIAFHHRHQGEMALARAELDLAFDHFRSARDWQPGDAPTHVFLGQVIYHAQANGLPLEALEGHEASDIFGFGLASDIHAIALSPADPYAWSGLVNVYQGSRSARIRYKKMREAGDAAAVGGAPLAPSRDEVTAARFDPEDFVSIAATLQGLELEPNFYFYHDYLAKLYWDRGFKTEAAAEIRESLTQWPRLEVHASLENDRMVRELSEPILQGLEASASNPFAGPVMAMLSRAEMLDRLGRTEEAIAAYDSVKKLGDPAIIPLCELTIGKLEVQRGRYREGIAALAPVLEDPSGRTYAAWALYYMGVARAGLGEHKEAASLFRRHLEAMPESLQGYLSLGAEEEINGRSDEAERLYIAAVVKYPADPTTYMRVIEQMRRHGKAKQALSYAEALRKVGQDEEAAERLIEQLRSEAASKHP